MMGYNPLCNTAISALESLGAVDRAIELQRRMHGLGVQSDIISRNTLLSACKRAKQWERALESMQISGLEPNLITFSTLTSACAEQGRWEHALVLLEVMDRTRHHPNVVAYGAVLSAFEKGIQWERALQVLAELLQRHVEVNVVVFNSVISACEKDALAAGTCPALLGNMAGGSS